MRVWQALLALGMSLFLSGCSTLTFGLLGDDGPEQVRAKGPTLGKMVDQLPELQLPAVASVKPSREDVMAAYNRVYGMLPSAKENHAVGKRLADLHMAVGEDQDIAGGAAPYQPAVDLYTTLLEQTEGAENVDEILYQLARAHDLVGQTDRTLHYINRLVSEYPQSAYVPEGRFRRAEIMFSADDYRAAAADYEYVVNLGDATPYYSNATYMLGWAEFKRSRYDEGLHQFFNVADDLLANASSEELSSIDSQLLEDSFRVITLALTYLDGAATLAEEMRKRGRPGLAIPGLPEIGRRLL